MNLTDVYVLLLLVQVAFSIWIIVKSPAVPDTSKKVAKFRIAAIAFGFVPEPGIALVLQLVLFGLYASALPRDQEERREIQAALVATDFEESSDAAYGHDSHTAPPVNPFD